VHAGEVDVLVGTQMITKGHDFRRITLVAAVNPDSALFSSDFRAPERLFALLMQAGGRAGRSPTGAAARCGCRPGTRSIRSMPPCASTTAAFAASQLKEREAAGLPPFATWRCCAPTPQAEAAQAFLQAAAELAATLPEAGAVSVYAPGAAAGRQAWPGSSACRCW
jgi:primosomal protein N' (replication factor Y)